ncbi:NAD+ synthase [Halorubrum ezzemoulense]|uniref:NAD+ synthase n=1 Tax=Halorubrum ezzemoulense TaxID=337243 RepID=UPI0023307E03|nr:NAD+ synthase [Halorubrum ezzemoulense]MDB2282687.1 NAD+ synthase [Halorubrum ezzemoulense]
MKEQLKVGVIQHNPVIGDIDGNLGKITKEYRQLADTEPDLVVTPELSIVGYPPRDLLHRAEILDAQEAALNDLALETADGPPLIVGAAVRTERDSGAPIHNAAIVLRDGKKSETYHKRLLPTYDVFDEHRYFQPGTDPVVVDIADTAIGLTICEDAWQDAVVTGTRRHDESPLQDTAASGADLIITLSASPFSLEKPSRREHRFATHAAETDCPVVFVNQVGGNDELIFDGHSLVAVDGAVHEQLTGFESSTTVVDVSVGGDATVPTGNTKTRATQARKALTLGVGDYFEKTGFEEAVVGLSGGIDSAVAAALAVAALDAENVYAVSLPSEVTSQQSIADAQTVAANLGIEFDVIPIGSAVEDISQTLDANNASLTGVAAENIQARIRGSILMGIANQRNALVLTPDNKSEAAVGYCTLYGDAVGALAPLGDCYKQLVYELAGVFNETLSSAGSSPVIPTSVIEKEPSAELRSGQADEEEIPAYEVLDPILEQYIEEGETISSIREEYPDHVVDEALRRTTHAEFKRRQTPPPLRITQKALGRGWNYPIAAAYDCLLDDH